MGATGNLVDPFNIRVEDISIEDIAHHLGRICRFNGAVTGFYSVADHCIKISNRASEENKLWGLLHDAAEAYLGDITRPVKQKFKSFVEPVEEEILYVIADKFGLPPMMPQEIIDLDNQILEEELELLEKGRLTGNPYFTSSKMFLMVFKDLTK
jgi:5'-deoxynucleotidase YfbR-like HD superfamily hydrolase